jgi:hypothetical protein
MITVKNKIVKVEITPHMEGVITRFNHYRSVRREPKVVGCSFDIETLLTQQAWMLAVYFAEQLRAAE